MTTLILAHPAWPAHSSQPHGDGADDALPRDSSSHSPTALTVEYYVQRASAGLIITEGN